MNLFLFCNKLYLNQHIYKLLTQFKRNDSVELTLCQFNKSTKILTYAGSKHALYLLKKNTTEIETIPQSKNFIGKPESDFEQHSVQLQEGDILYLSSDGYFDQPGGKNGRKMMRNNFLQKLSHLSPFDLPTQKEMLEKHFREWCNDKPQIDDVCVLGLKI